MDTDTEPAPSANHAKENIGTKKTAKFRQAAVRVLGEPLTDLEPVLQHTLFYVAYLAIGVLAFKATRLVGHIDADFFNRIEAQLNLVETLTTEIILTVYALYFVFSITVTLSVRLFKQAKGEL